ncbi:MAG: thiamine pyrophosphate-binding protein, partial [Candidatus Latescibacteria bacterium]|nr:thiamine pyrophosphate-binding protein [Candidatus Latescibacterota bacterium]
VVLQQVAVYLQAPVITTPDGKGALTDRHYLSIGVLKHRDDPLREHLTRYDVILAVGTRFATARLPDGHQVVQIDVDEEEIGRNYTNTFGIVGDARRSLEELYRALLTMTPARSSRQAECEEIRAERFAPSSQLEPQHSLLRAIRAAMPDDGILVSGLTQVGYYSYVFYPVYAPRTYITSSYFGNLGYAYPTALGAKVARPDKAVVAISGDGGFLFNSQELATAVQYSINAIVIVFNDNAYGNVLRDQINRFNGRTIGACLHNPDFVKLARAYGARGVRAKDPERLESALREALSLDAPTLIEVPVGMMPSPF